MSVRTKKRIQRDWAAIFAEFRRSGLSIKEFCQTQQMSPSLFYRRRKDHDDPAHPGKSAPRSSDFIQLKPAAVSRPSAAIVFFGQIELSVANDCDKELLRYIISQLKGPPC
jgi:hypothetical protein